MDKEEVIASFTKANAFFKKFLGFVPKLYGCYSWILNPDLQELPLTINSDHIQFSNSPDSSYEYDILTKQIDVTVVGPADSLAEITAEDIIGEVNLLNTSITEEQFNQNVLFSCPSFDDVWVATNSKVTIQRTKAEKATSTAR